MAVLSNVGRSEAGPNAPGGLNAVSAGNGRRRRAAPAFTLALHARLALLALAASLAACATPRSANQAGPRLVPPVIVEDVLGVWQAPPFRATQLVTGNSRGTSYQALFEIEWRDQVLTIVAMSLMGLPIFEARGSAAGVFLVSKPGREGAGFDPAWVISDFLLATAPAELLQRALRERGASIGVEAAKRQLIGADGGLLITLNYADERFLTARLEIDNRLVGYQLTVETLQFEVIE